MWIETSKNKLVNTDKLAAIQGDYRNADYGYKEFFIYGLYTPGIRYSQKELTSSKDSISILYLFNTDLKRSEYIYKNIFEKLKSSFSSEEKFMSVPKMIEKYSTEFDEIKGNKNGNKWSYKYIKEAL